jgi:hypothetical protein
VSYEDTSGAFREITSAIAPEMAQHAEQHLQLVLSLAHQTIPQSVVDERFTALTEELDGRNMMFNVALAEKCMLRAARLIMCESPNSERAERLVTRSMAKRYGFSTDEIAALMRRKMTEEALNDAAHKHKGLDV